MPIDAPVNLSKIKSEFGTSNMLSAYYRGGPNVPIGAKNTISTTVEGLAISQFLGSENSPLVNFELLLTNIYATGDRDVDYNPGSSSITLKADGTYTVYETYWMGSGEHSGTWFTGSLDNVECRKRLDSSAWSGYSFFTGAGVSAYGADAPESSLEIEFRVINSLTSLGKITLWANAN